MESVYVSIYVIRDKAYIPVMANTAVGGIYTEPIISVNLNLNALSKAILQSKSLGNPTVPDQIRKARKPSNDPLLKAAKLRSWKSLKSEAIGYDISWEVDEKTIYYLTTRVDSVEWDISKSREFPIDTPIETIVEIILEDINSRKGT